VYAMNSTGPRPEPCGTPKTAERDVEVEAVLFQLFSSFQLSLFPSVLVFLS